jgi:hypothetical protein
MSVKPAIIRYDDAWVTEEYKWQKIQLLRP